MLVLGEEALELTAFTELIVWASWLDANLNKGFSMGFICVQSSGMRNPTSTQGLPPTMLDPLI